ncbi:hypothetical protein KCP77_21410 [Salmonella enterica subsp. enterica]|nr:hypothetical protein KCP77_21410 [Salmonella enterica subsp. enterica]
MNGEFRVTAGGKFASPSELRLLRLGEKCRQRTCGNSAKFRMILNLVVHPDRYHCQHLHTIAEIIGTDGQNSWLSLSRHLKYRKMRAVRLAPKCWK